VGGPNAEYALALAYALDGVAGIHAIACDTDGVDGAAEVAGAIIGEQTLQQAKSIGLKARAFLDRNDSHTFFCRIGAQVITGPTLTNVNDFRGVLIS
jgi:hydroxypyruvate reductase